MDELVDALRALDDDEEIRCIVVGGSERAFAAGADIRELAGATPIELYADRRIDQWDAIRVLRTPLQMIAVTNRQPRPRPRPAEPSATLAADGLSWPRRVIVAGSLRE